MTKKKITVIGSINMDLVTKTKQIPKVGETLLGESFATIPGGKGANQAVAAARLGANVTLIGCVGDDAFGEDLTKHLQSEGIQMEYVNEIADTATGIAAITISEGDNSIIVVPGANYSVTPNYVAKHEEVIAASDILLLQLEIPLESVIKATELARKHDVVVILNPAPIQPLPKSLLQMVNYLTPNEHEQKLLFASNEWTVTEQKEIRDKCVVTKGSKGVSLYGDSDKEIIIPSFRVEVVDTTGAGDSFNGALAVALSNGENLESACHFANVVGAISVTKLGAQSGMPSIQEVDLFLQSQKG